MYEPSPSLYNGSDKRGEGVEIGVYTFGELIPDPQTGRAISARQRLQEIVAAAKLADEAGLDVFGVGEHHRLDMAVLPALRLRPGQLQPALRRED